jgi:glycosyltransferase involved in cell wall biosynthesis
MKIIFVIDSLANSGTERSLLDILSHFSINTKAILVYLQPPHLLKNNFDNAGIKTIWLNENKKQNFVSNLFLLNKIIRAEQPDFVVSSLYKSNILSRFSCLLTKTKLIGTFVSDSYSKLRFSNYNLKQKIGFFFIKQFDKITATIPIAFISNSHSVKISNCKHLQIAKSKVKVIYRGRDTEQIVRWNQPIDNSKFVFIIISRVLKTKGFDELIAAFSIAKKTYSNIILEIYGDGNYAESIKKLSTQLGLTNSILFKGNQPNAWQYLYNANCFIFPSWYEGLSGALIEATVSGIPIIASNIPMNIEVIKSCKTVLLHQVKDTQSIIDCMTTIIENYNEYVAHSTSARKIATEKFDISMIARKYEDFFVSLSNKQ